MPFDWKLPQLDYSGRDKELQIASYLIDARNNVKWLEKDYNHVWTDALSAIGSTPTLLKVVDPDTPIYNGTIPANVFLDVTDKGNQGSFSAPAGQAMEVLSPFPSKVGGGAGRRVVKGQGNVYFKRTGGKIAIGTYCGEGWGSATSNTDNGGLGDDHAMDQARASLVRGGVIGFGDNDYFLDNQLVGNRMRYQGIGNDATAAYGTKIKPSNPTSGNPIFYTADNFRQCWLHSLNVDVSSSVTNPALRIRGNIGTSGFGFRADNTTFFGNAMNAVGSRYGALTEVDGTTSWAELVGIIWAHCIWNHGGANTANMWLRSTNMQMEFISRFMFHGYQGVNIWVEANNWIKDSHPYVGCNGPAYSYTRTFDRAVVGTLTTGRALTTSGLTPEDTGQQIINLSDSGNSSGFGVGSNRYVSEVTKSTAGKTSAAPSSTQSGVTFSIYRQEFNGATLGKADYYFKGPHGTVNIIGGSDEGIKDRILHDYSAQVGGIVNLQCLCQGRITNKAGLLLLNLNGSEHYSGFLNCEGGTMVVNADPVSLGGYAPGPGANNVIGGYVEKPVFASRRTGAILMPKLQGWIQLYNLDTASSSFKPLLQASVPHTQWLDLSQSAPISPLTGALRKTVNWQNGIILNASGLGDIADPEQGFFGWCDWRSTSGDGWKEEGYSADELFTPGGPQQGTRHYGAGEWRDYVQAQRIYIFAISAGTAINGATYSSTTGAIFTVRVSISGETRLVCKGTGSPASSGTLTRTSAPGSGDATLTFSSYVRDFGMRFSEIGPQFNLVEVKNPVVDTDRFLFQDPASGWMTKAITGTNFKAWLKSYFDTVYLLATTALSALAALTPAASRIPYFTSSSAAGLLTLDTDVTLAANSDTALASQKATKTYADARETAAKSYADGLVVGLWDDRGTYNASGNAFPSSGGSGAAGAIKKGDIWTIASGGDGFLGGVEVKPGDTVRALVDSPGSTATNWALGENNFGFTPLNKASNLSDLASPPTARTNLALGTGDSPSFAAVTATGSGGIHATGGNIGYGAGAGTSVLQATDRSTDVTANKQSGFVLTTNESLANGATKEFRLFSSKMNATCEVSVWIEQDLQDTTLAVVDSLVDCIGVIRVDQTGGNYYAKIRYRNNSGGASTNYTRFGFAVRDASNS